MRLDDFTVLHPEHALAVLYRLRAVSHQQHGRMGFAHDFGQQAEHLLSRGRIQAARRLVRQNQRRPMHHRPCDRHALHLSSRKLSRQRRSAMRNAHTLQQFPHP